jgi:hypothetical protein
MLADFIAVGMVHPNALLQVILLANKAKIRITKNYWYRKCLIPAGSMGEIIMSLVNSHDGEANHDPQIPWLIVRMAPGYEGPVLQYHRELGLKRCVYDPDTTHQHSCPG